MFHKKNIIFACISLAVFSLTACNSSQKNDTDADDTANAGAALTRIKTLAELEQITPVPFVLKSHNLKNDTDEKIVLATPEKVTFQVKDARVIGNAGVNRYSIALSFAPDGTTAWTPGLSTKMAGAEDLMRFENAYLKALPEVVAIRQDDAGNLVFSSKNEPRLLVFSAQ